MKPFQLLFMLGILWGVMGCATQMHQVTPVEPPSVPARTTLPIPLAAVDDRIQSLETRLSRNHLTHEEKKLIQQLLNTYRTIKRMSQEPYLTTESYDTLVHSLFQSLTTSEQQFFECTSAQKTSSAGVTRFLQMRQEIFNAFLNRNYQFVVNQSRILQDTFGPEALTPDIAIVYALSLAQTGDLKTALSVGDLASSKLDQIPDSVRLKTAMAETALRLGRKDKAIKDYEVLLDIHGEERALIKKLGKDLKQEVSPSEGPNVPSAPIPEVESKPEALPTYKTLDALLQAVDALVQKKAYQEAKLLLIRHRLTFNDESTLKAIDHKLQEIEDLQKEYEEERSIREAYVKETLDGAKRLMDAEQFEDAVDKLDKMEGDKEFMAEASALRARAVENIINRERNQAAKRFLEAKRTTDPQKKETLLKESYNILKALNEKYPSSPLNEKVLSNMEIVKSELEKVREENR